MGPPSGTRAPPWAPATPPKPPPRAPRAQRSPRTLFPENLVPSSPVAAADVGRYALAVMASSPGETVIHRISALHLTLTRRVAPDGRTPRTRRKWGVQSRFWNAASATTVAPRGVVGLAPRVLAACPYLI
jgi:hypothetical protein